VLYTVLTISRSNLVRFGRSRAHFDGILPAHIRKTPLLLFGAFSCFFYFFHKKVEKARKSQVLHLPECFPRGSKKYIAFKSIKVHVYYGSTGKKRQVGVRLASKMEVPVFVKSKKVMKLASNLCHHASSVIIFAVRHRHCLSPHHRLSLSIAVRHRLLLSFTVHRHLSPSVTVRHCPSLSIAIHHCPSPSITVCHHPSLSITVRHCLSPSVIVYHCPSLSVAVRHCLSLSITVHRRPSLSVAICHCPSPSVTVHRHPSLSVAVHHCPSPSIISGHQVIDGHGSSSGHGWLWVVMGRHRHQSSVGVRW